MKNSQQWDIVRRFIRLPLEKRRLFLDSLHQQGGDFSKLPIPPQLCGDDEIPLSLVQQGLWILHQLDPTSTAYHIAGGVSIGGALDRGALQQVFDTLSARHDALRTVFYAVDGQPRQRILPASSINIDYHDLSGLDIETAQRQAGQLAEADVRRPFDLERGPLWRVTLVRLPAASDAPVHELNLSLHHLIADGWSMNRLLAEFAECYVATQEVRSPQLPPLPIRHADYAVWQRSWLEAGESQRQLAYWTERLGGEQPVIELPYDRPRPADPSQRGGWVGFALSESLSYAIQQLAQQNGATVFMVLLAAFKVLLYRYSSQTDLRIGLPLANRNRPESQNLIGYFVNTVVLRSDIDSRLPFRNFLAQVKHNLLEAQAHPDLPFEHLVDALQPERRLGQNPLFQVLINQQQRDVSALQQQNGWEIRAIDRDNGAAQFDLSLDTEQDGNGRIGGFFTYAQDLFDATTIESLAGHYQHLLAQLVGHPGIAIGVQPLLTNSEQAQLAAWNVREKRYDEHTPVHELIRRKAERQGDAGALICGDDTLSYAELQLLSRRLAQSLLTAGVKAGDVVGLCLPRSAEAIAACLAVWQCGGAFLPLDPDYPSERLSYILADAGVACLLSCGEGHCAHPASATPFATLDLDQLDLGAYPAALFDYAPHPEQTAYLIYTSGSTGPPKGVAVSHGALALHVQAMADVYAMQPGDVCLHFASFSFDAAIEQWAVPLSCGAKVVVSEQTLYSVEQTLAMIDAHCINRIDLPPAYLAELARHIADPEQAPVLASCTGGGEALPRDSLALIQNRLRPQRLLNAYGPTESVITPLVWEAEDHCESTYAPIGTAIGSRSTYILDADLNPVPIGVAGELYIGGPELAQGYWYKPSLTAVRFIPDPFSGQAGARLYRSGDRVRRRPDGSIDYLGRLDQQIKLRGYRIEPGEIEAALLAQAGVAEAAVIVGENGQLLAYAAVNTITPVLPGEARENTESLRQSLQDRLPDYMLPSHIVILPQLPRLPSGKLDRKALPAPECSARTRTAPRNAIERQLVAIWQEVLGLEDIGVEDNFFELGGDSILSIRVVSRAREAGWLITPRELFLHQTVATLATVAQLARQAGDTAVVIVSGEAALTPIQVQFFQENMPNRHHWNLSLLLQARQALDEDRLEQALQTLMRNHESLRLRYRTENGVWCQYYADVASGDIADLVWRCHAQDSAEVESIANQAQRSLDLQQGPLLRAACIHVADGSQRLLLVVHHLVVDGVSWRILLEDLQSLYDDDRPLPAKTASFQHWAQCLQIYAHSEALLQQTPYWLQQADMQLSDIPRDYPQNAGCYGNARSLSLKFPAATTRQLLQQAPSAYRTQVNDLLLTVLARVLCRWSGRERVFVELESHGRQELFDNTDLSRSVGWFTSLYPVCLPAIDEMATAIKTVKEILRGVPDGGLGFGVLKYLSLTEHRERLSALPTPKVSFNYFGQFETGQSLFAVAPETAGDDRDMTAPLPSWLEINAQVLNGELEVRWRYSEKQYRTATVQGLLDAYRDELTVLITHCLSGAKGATPADFPLAGLIQPQLDKLPVAIETVEEIYPLSPMQQGILFHALLEPETGVYVNQMTLDINGLDVQRFAAAWRRAIARHDILRSAFIWRGEADHPLQVVYKHVKLPLEILDWRGRAFDDAQLAALQAEEHARGFDPAQAPLMRLLLVQLSERRYRWIWSSHHILLDGWSTSQLLGEVLQTYAGGDRQTGSGRYRDFIAWLQRKNQSDSEQFWRQRLANLDEPTRLADMLAIGGGSGHGNYSDRLDANITRRLQAFAQSQRVTLNTLLQGAWALLLQRYCSRKTVTFGITVSVRPAQLPGVDSMLGLFINSLPLIVASKPEQCVGDWLRSLQNDNSDLREHEQTPLYDIQRWAGQPGAGLFDTLLVFENYPVDEALRNADTGLQFGSPMHIDTTHYPLTLNISIGNTLGLTYGYWQDRFDAGDVQALDRHYRQLLLRMTGDADCSVAHLSLLTEAEQTQQTHWNATTRQYPSGFIHELISQRAACQPDAAALVFDEQVLSYADLERCANRLAHYLIGLGVGPETPVGIAVERSFELVIALLAVVKAGGAYVPLDPDYPAERLAYMIEDSGITLLLSHGPVWSKVQDIGSTRCASYRLDTLDLSGQPEHAPSPALHPENPAYIIYTSGSTGRPKGASNSHAALANRLHWMQEAYAIGPEDTILQKTPFSFDVSVWEFFWPLLTGARLAIAEPGAHRDPAALAALMLTQHISVLHFVPSMLAEFVNQPELPLFPQLKRIVCSGEALSVELQQRVFQRLPGVELDNLYGPTEAAIDVTHWTCRDDGNLSVPIGKPIANTQIHILDADFNPLPVGVAGELYIGGRGLARGYHRRPGLTGERFLPDLFSNGDRLYRTGDRARWRIDGAIEYLGRVDHQVKLRGLRIELGEIEAALLAQNGVNEAVVLLKDAVGGPRLVAYLVSDSEEAGNDVLLQALRLRLPEYMLPSAMVYLDSLPKTANGKLDRKALPDPCWSGREFQPPNSETEQVLAAIWQALLGVERVGLRDNFFELGGHSLLAMKLVGRIKQTAGVDLPVRRIFETPQLVMMAAEIDRLQQSISSTANLQEDIAEALEQLQGLSADELQELLANENGI